MDEQNKNNFDEMPADESKEKKKAPQKSGANGKLAIIIGAIAIAVVAVIVAVILLMGNNNNPSNNDGSNNVPSLDAHTHHFDAWETKTEATCTIPGVQERYCSCGEKQSKPISATGKHIYTSEISKESTCVSNGIKTYYCQTCDNSYTESIDISTKHTYVSGKCVHCSLYDISNAKIGIIYDVYDSTSDLYNLYAFFYDSNSNLIPVDFTATVYVYDYTGENVILAQSFTKKESDFEMHQSQFNGEMLGCKLSIERSSIPDSISPDGFFVTDVHYQNGGYFSTYGEISNLPFDAGKIAFDLEMPNVPLETTNAGVSGGSVKTETFNINELTYEIISLNKNGTYSVKISCSGEKTGGNAPSYLMGEICLTITDSNGNTYTEGIPIIYSSNNKFKDQSIILEFDITKTYTVVIKDYNFWV